MGTLYFTNNWIEDGYVNSYASSTGTVVESGTVLGLNTGEVFASYDSNSQDYLQLMAPLSFAAPLEAGTFRVNQEYVMHISFKARATANDLGAYEYGTALPTSSIPSTSPTSKPSFRPSISSQPTPSPSPFPTKYPSTYPSKAPTKRPTECIAGSQGLGCNSNTNCCAGIGKCSGGKPSSRTCLGDSVANPTTQSTPAPVGGGDGLPAGSPCSANGECASGNCKGNGICK